MDDLIEANGGNAFKEAVASGPGLIYWEQQLSRSDRKSQVLIHPKFESQQLTTTIPTTASPKNETEAPG